MGGRAVADVPAADEKRGALAPAEAAGVVVRTIRLWAVAAAYPGLRGIGGEMERYVRFVVRHRVVVVVATLLVTAFFAAQLRHLHMEIRRRANLPDEHPFVKVQNRMSDLFGGEGVVIIGVIVEAAIIALGG